MVARMSGRFHDRHQAEMTVERLVQEFGIDRKKIVVNAEGTENSARGIAIEVKAEDEAMAQKIRAAFEEFQAGQIVEDPAD